MRKQGGGCDIEGLTKETFRVAREFIANESIQNRFGPEATGLVKTVFERMYTLPLEQIKATTISKGTVKTFKRKLDRIAEASKSGKLTSKFGSIFYTPESIMQSNPHLATLHDNLHNVTLNFQGRVGRHNKSFEKILGFTKRLMLEREFGERAEYSLLQRGKVRANLKKIRKLADDHEKAIESLKLDVENNIAGADNLLSEAIKAETVFYNNQEGKVFNDIIKTVETVLPEIDADMRTAWFGDEARGIVGKGDKFYKQMKSGEITKAKFDAIRKKALEPILSKKIEEQPMRNLVAEYVQHMEEMYAVTKKGIVAYGETIKQNIKGKYKPADVDNIVKKVVDKMMPDKVKGYYPHYRRVLGSDFFDNLMPRLQRVADATAESFKSDQVGVDKALDELDTYVTKHTTSRQVFDLGKDFDPKNEYSKNFFVNVKRYTDEIDRFNMIAHADQYTAESLNAAKEMFKKGEDIDNFAQSTVEMMVDLNARMRGGYGFENANAEAAMKTLLALEFTSKLGLNLRSPAKNATQGLLNLVEFGPITMLRAKDFYKQHSGRDGIASKVDEMMEEAGFLFADDLAPELFESNIAGKSFLSKVKISDGETIEFTKPAFFASSAKKAGKLAATTGKLMGKVENFNRKTTFKTAFYEMYNQLDNSTAFKDNLEAQGLSQAKVQAEVMKRARNYAIRKTTLLHFDYSDISKSAWQTHPAGRLLGQFQHYGMKFFEYNLNLAREGKDDVLAGELLGSRAQKAYKMGLIYLVAPAIASAVTGFDFGNVIEHDTKEKMNKLFTLFTGDDEEIKNAYYGKGILTQLPFIGAPVVSDAISLGNIAGFIQMEDKHKAKLISGWEDYALKSNDQKAYEVIRTLNTSIGRLVYKTLPKAIDDPFGALGYELGFYRTKEARKLREAATKDKLGKKALLPEELLNALSALDSHIDSATKQRALKSIKSGKKGPISLTERTY